MRFPRPFSRWLPSKVWERRFPVGGQSQLACDDARRSPGNSPPEMFCQRDRPAKARLLLRPPVRRRGLALCNAGLLAALALPGGAETVRQGALELLSWRGQPWFAQPAEADPQAEAIVRQYLDRLQAAGIDPAQQGVWLESGRQVLAAHQGTVPRSAASLTKLSTTLAALETWGTQHQFVTEVWARGTIANGTLQGDLIVRGGGDPFFVWEEGFALGNALEAAGLRRATGDLRVDDRFFMNFLPDPQEPNRFPPEQSGELLKQAIDVGRWPAQAHAIFAQGLPGSQAPQVAIAGEVVLEPARAEPPADAVLLVRHRSLPLADILQQMNIYSNNAISERLAAELGGPQRVAEIVAAAADLEPGQIQQVSGSGLGQANRFSPRAVAAILRKLQNHLQFAPILEGAPQAAARAATGRLGANPVATTGPAIGRGTDRAPATEASDRRLRRKISVSASEIAPPAEVTATAPPSALALAATPAYTVADLLPVSGTDVGTLVDRAVPVGAAVKTGSLWDVSALAGALPTRDRGLVWFAIVNRNPKLDTLRREQDWLLQALQGIWGRPEGNSPALVPRLNAGSPARDGAAGSRYTGPSRPPVLGDRDRLDVLWPPNPETDSPETDSPETDSPETDSPETDSPETDSPAGDAPEDAAAPTAPAAPTDPLQG